MAFSPWWLNALMMSATAFVPLWMYVQYWWNPDFGGWVLVDSAGVVMFILGLIVLLISLGDRDTPERLELPRWRDFRKDWRLRGR